MEEFRRRSFHPMNKLLFVRQMSAKLRSAQKVATRTSAEAAVESRNGATSKEKTEDSRVSLENAGLARGQKRRAAQVAAELKQLETFLPVEFGAGASIGLGAMVEIEDEDSGVGRTFFLAPVGAGMEVTMPGGDGFLSVVTLASPVGRACYNRKVGDSIEVTVKGETRYWEITWVE